MFKRFLATILLVNMVISSASLGILEVSAQNSASNARTSDQQAMDKLLAPIALYPDALLAQVLTCSGSPQQITEINDWMKQNDQLKGTELQQAAEAAGFDASFIAMVLFPDVLTFLEQNLEWTTEVGKAFNSSQKEVLDSVQSLRAQAKAVGNLVSTPQQEVKTETQEGQTVIVVQPANPQVVYVPQYNPQTVYTEPPPPPPPAEDNTDKVVAAAVISFAVGIALGAAMSNNYGYYGWGGCGMHWHSGVVVIRGGVWRPPPGRYPYARPVPRYRAPANVRAPRYNNINVNIDNSRNVNRQNVNTGGRTPRPVTTSAPSTRNPRPKTTAAGTGRSQTTGNANRGRTRTASTATASPARQMERGANTSAFSGYQRGSSERAASARGRRSSGSQRSGGRRRQ